MGRNNRSRKRRDEMNKIKKVRYEAKELIRLKKTLGLIDAEGNEIMKDISEVAQVKTSKEIKRVSYAEFICWSLTKSIPFRKRNPKRSRNSSTSTRRA